MNHLPQIFLQKQVQLLILAKKLQRKSVFVPGHADNTLAVLGHSRHGLVLQRVNVMVVRVDHSKAQILVRLPDGLGEVCHRSGRAHTRQFRSQPAAASLHHMTLGAVAFSEEDALALGRIAGHWSLRTGAYRTEVRNQSPSLAILKCVGRHLGAGDTIADGSKDFRVAAAMHPKAGTKVWPAPAAARIETVARGAIGAE